MLKNNLRLELETIHHDPRRQAGRMTKSSSANRPQTEYGGSSLPHLSGTEQIVGKTLREKSVPKVSVLILNHAQIFIFWNATCN